MIVSTIEEAKALLASKLDDGWEPITSMRAFNESPTGTTAVDALCTDEERGERKRDANRFFARHGRLGAWAIKLMDATDGFAWSDASTTSERLREFLALDDERLFGPEYDETRIQP